MTFKNRTKFRLATQIRQIRIKTNGVIIVEATLQRTLQVLQRQVSVVVQGMQCHRVVQSQAMAGSHPLCFIQGVHGEIALAQLHIGGAQVCVTIRAWLELYRLFKSRYCIIEIILAGKNNSLS